MNEFAKQEYARWLQNCTGETLDELRAMDGMTRSSSSASDTVRPLARRASAASWARASHA